MPVNVHAQSRFCICMIILFVYRTVLCYGTACQMKKTERSGSAGRALDWGIQRLLVQDSLPAVSLCCFLEQDTFSAA